MRDEDAVEEKAEASRGWLMRFKARSHFCNRKVPGEAANADVEAAVGSTEDLAKILTEGGCTKQQILSVDGTAFYWKKMPSKNFIERKVSAWLQNFKV